MLDFLSISAISGLFFSRDLQTLPNYTSPPLDIAIAATPAKFRNDTYLNLIREAAGENDCEDNGAMENCQMLFSSPYQNSSSGASQIGIVLYGGALVDPRSYSVMAKTLSERYGFVVSIPIFANDVAYLGCNGTHRIPLAMKAFPEVEKWVLVGHSMGGVGAQVDLWNEVNAEEKKNKIGGMVLLASNIRQDFGCGEIDFSETNIPMAGVSASLDMVLNSTNSQAGVHFFPVNDTLYIDIIGGNHGYFGYYNYSLRTPILGQNDGNATVPRAVQLDLTVGAIANVAARMGLSLPSMPITDTVSKDATSPSVILSSQNVFLSTVVVSVFFSL